MWLTGFDKLMPEGRSSPYKYLPRPGVRLSVTFGDPLTSGDIEKVFTAANVESPLPWDSETTRRKGSGYVQNEENKTRAEVTALVQRAVESLGRSISGDSLSESI
jgi:monolysocardiolipin acyltransferase